MEFKQSIWIAFRIESNDATHTHAHIHKCMQYEIRFNQVVHLQYLKKIVRFFVCRSKNGKRHSMRSDNVYNNILVGFQFYDLAHLITRNSVCKPKMENKIIIYNNSVESYVNVPLFRDSTWKNGANTRIYKLQLTIHILKRSFISVFSTLWNSSFDFKPIDGQFTENSDDHICHIFVHSCIFQFKSYFSFLSKPKITSSNQISLK